MIDKVTIVLYIITILLEFRGYQNLKHDSNTSGYIALKHNNTIRLHFTIGQNIQPTYTNDIIFMYLQIIIINL